MSGNNNNEAATLASDLLKNLELSELPLTNMFMKGARLARLLNDADMQQIFQYEVSGYPSGPGGIPQDVWRYCKLGKRAYPDKDKDGTVLERANTESISATEQFINASSAQLGVASDPNVSISSANPHQFLQGPSGNAHERTGLKKAIVEATGRLASRRAFLYAYVLEKYYELKFSGIAEDAFGAIRQTVDNLIGNFVPGSAQKLVAVFENLESENPENWANAVHSCRRILQDVADALFPPTDNKIIQTPSGEKEIKLGADQYVNRLIAFIETRSSSERFDELVGSHLKYIGERLDSIFRAAQKGSHANVTRGEARRYALYTYMLVGDVLSLKTD